jgi:hypothetical protein
VFTSVTGTLLDIPANPVKLKLPKELNMKLQGGLDMNAERFSDDVREVVKDLLPHVRLVAQLPKEAEAGPRFHSTDTMLWRVESMFSEDEFLREPLKVIEAALIDAARSDWWYAHEKECDYPQEDYESEGDAC